MLDVERWAELRREHFVRGVSIKELERRTGLARNTIRAALRSDAPPAFRVPERPSKLDPFKEEIHDLLRRDPKLPGVRVRELIEPLGFDGSKTIVDDYLREVRPLFVKTRTHQRTIYRPGEICQWDLWEPSAHVPVGHGQVRRAWVVVACLAIRASPPARSCSQRRRRTCVPGMSPLPAGVWRAAAADGLGPRGFPARRRRRPTDAYAAFCGQLPVDWYFCEAADPSEGRRRAPAGIPGEQLRARPALRQPPRLPAAARRVVSEGQRPRAQDAQSPPDRPPGRRARADASAA